MTNAVFSTGSITKEVGELVSKFRLVKLTDGKVVHNDADSFPYGQINQAAEPAAEARPADYVAHGLPHLIAVNTAQVVVEVETEAELTAGATVYAAADGKVAETGTVAVGIAERETKGTRVRVNLFHPSIFAAGGGV